MVKTRIDSIATASVNGMRTNLEGLMCWLQRRQPDIVALQKIRVSEAEFMNLATRKLQGIGYRAVVLGKTSRWDYGVAILSRTDLPELEEIACGLPGTESDGARFLTVEVSGLWFSSIYAPYGKRKNGPSMIDRRVAWLQRLREHIEISGYDGRDSVLCGDFNVTPDLQLGMTGHYTEREQRELAELCKLGFIDLYRRAHPDPNEEPGHTFGFQYNPKGTSRLHLILASESFARRSCNAYVDDHRIRRESRPVIVILDDTA